MRTSHSWCKTTFLCCFLLIWLSYFKGKSHFSRERERTTCRAASPWKVCVCVRLKESVCLNVYVSVSCRISRSSSLTFPGHSVIKWLLCLPPPLFLLHCFSVFTSQRQEVCENDEENWRENTMGKRGRGEFSADCISFAGFVNWQIWSRNLSKRLSVIKTQWTLCPDSNDLTMNH